MGYLHYRLVPRCPASFMLTLLRIYDSRVTECRRNRAMILAHKSFTLSRGFYFMTYNIILNIRLYCIKERFLSGRFAVSKYVLYNCGHSYFRITVIYSTIVLQYPANMCNWATGGAQMGCHLGPKWAAHLGPN